MSKCVFNKVKFSHPPVFHTVQFCEKVYVYFYYVSIFFVRMRRFFLTLDTIILYPKFIQISAQINFKVRKQAFTENRYYLINAEI